MVELETFGDCAVAFLEEEPMGAHHRSAMPSDEAVSARQGSQPDPTLGVVAKVYAAVTDPATPVVTLEIKERFAFYSTLFVRSG